jgi:hypothetical protein
VSRTGSYFVSLSRELIQELARISAFARSILGFHVCGESVLIRLCEHEGSFG